MADNEPITPDNWNSPQLRKGILLKIQETLNTFGVTTNKSPVELERSVFQKATTKDQYLSFVARLIIHLKNNVGTRPGMQGPGGTGGVPGQGGPMLQSQLQQLGGGGGMMQQGQPGPGMQQQSQQQMNLLQQQQHQHQQQMNALNQQQQQQQLQAQMAKSQQMGQPQQQQQQQIPLHMQQSQMLANANGNALNSNISLGPNSVKMGGAMMMNNNNPSGPGMNSGANEPQSMSNEQMANMLAMQKAKNNAMQTGNLSIVNSSFNPQMGINNSNSLANMGPSGVQMGNLNAPSSTATAITSILNSNNSIKPKLVGNNGGGNGLQPTHINVTLNSQVAGGQLGGGLTLQQQQQLAQHQQQARMLQPNVNSIGGPNNMMPTARMMMSQAGIRVQQQANQINLGPNMQAQLRLRQVGPGTMQIQQQQSQNQSGPLPIYIPQQAPQGQQHQGPPGQNASAGGQGGPNQEAKFFEISNLGQANQRITPVTIGMSQQGQFKPTGNVMNVVNSSAPGGNFVHTFTNNLPTGGQSQIVASNSAQQMNHGLAPSISATSGPIGPNNMGMQANLTTNVPQMVPQNKQPIGGPQMGAPMGQSQMQQQGNKLLSAPAPGNLAGNPNLTNSPGNFQTQSPASVQSVPMMSPAGRQAMSAPSPQSALNTPASPGQAITPAQKASIEQKNQDAVYTEKLQSMQKYLQPLLDLIKHLSTDPRKERELDRLRNLYGILTNARKMNIEFLEKCESALEKMEKDQRFLFRSKVAVASESSPAVPSIPSVPPQPTPTSQSTGPAAGAPTGPTAPQPSGTVVLGAGAGPPAASKIQDICQPLIDAVMKNYDKPMFAHTLARTFGPALAVLHHEPYKPKNRIHFTANYVFYSNKDSANGAAANKRKSTPAAGESSALTNEVLQGEIARLDGRFHVQPLISSKRSSTVGPRSQHLLCRLDDLNLPCVPPLKVYISESYPDIPPHYLLEKEDYQTSPFFLRLYTFFSQNLFKLTTTYTLTALLFVWERSVRQAVCQDEEQFTSKSASVVDEDKENARASTPVITMVN